MKKILPLIFLCSCLSAHAQQTPAVLKQKAFTLVRFLERNHYQPVMWNDSASALLFEKWLDRLDGEQMFFTANDVSALAGYQYKLDDELLGKDWNFFAASVNMYRNRLQKTDSIIQLILSKPLDLSKPDKLEWPNTTYAASEQALMQRWMGYLKWRVLNRIADNMNEEEKLPTAMPVTFANLEATARQQVKQQENTYLKNLLSGFEENMHEAYLNSIAWCYDPHTSYMNIGKKKEFETEMSAAEYTAGFELEENEKGDLVIGFLQPGGSAWRSGKLHNGDILLKVKINGVEKNVADISAEELENILSGNSQEDVEVTIKTAAGEQKTVRLVKEKITDEESIVKSYVLHGKKNIGYINLPGFYSRESANARTEKDLTYDGCANDVSKEIVKLKKDTIAGLILDLRYNGGGSMWEAMQLAGIFIDIGPVASVKEKDGKVRLLKDPNRGTIYDGPLLVLLNGSSASASEFLSAALQDYNRAIIVGSNTYGKGTAQSVLPMDTGLVNPNKNYEDFVKVTGQKFYRVNGSTTQWKGVIPDISLPDMFGGDMYKEKSGKSALKPDESKTWPYEMLPPLAIQNLRAKSGERVAGSEYFKTIAVLNDFSARNSTGRTIPLSWTTYATHYNKTMELFRQAGGDEKKSTAISVSNNAFDRERINLSTTKSREINDVYLGHVQEDKTIEEAFQILMDWQAK